jgi:hypothetical protein
MESNLLLKNCVIVYVKLTLDQKHADINASELTRVNQSIQYSLVYVKKRTCLTADVVKAEKGISLDKCYVVNHSLLAVTIIVGVL